MRALELTRRSLSGFPTAKCIDEYIQQRVAAAEAKEEADIDERLVAIVERMFDRCMADKQHRQVSQ